MKKIVFFIGSLGGGGAERVTINLANYLSKKYSITLIVFSKDNNNYDVSDKVSLKFLPDKIHCFSNIKRVFALKKILKSENPDVVISLGLGYNFLFFGNLLKKYNFILSERNSPEHYYKTFMAKVYVKYCYKRAKCVVFQTVDAANYFKNVVNGKSAVIPNAIKEGLPAPYRGVRNNKIVAVNRLDPQKNIVLLLEGFKCFLQKYPNYILEIYGKGSQKEELLDLVRNLSIEKNVSFKGQVKNVYEKILDAKMFVSTSDYEGMSNSMLEAMAIGLPVICTDCPIGGARAVIKNDNNGILIPTNDVNALVNAMFYIIENPEHTYEMSLNASRLKTELSVEKISIQWDKLVSEM